MRWPTWRGRQFHLLMSAITLGLMGGYVPPPPVEIQRDEVTLAVDHLLESEIGNWLESLAPMDPRPGQETEGEP